MRATRNEGFSWARANKSSRVVKASAGGAWMRNLLLLICAVLLCGGCTTNATSTGNTSANAPDGIARPAPSQVASDARASVRPSPAASGSPEVTSETAQMGPGVVRPTQTASEANDESAEASKAYGGFYEVLGARPKGFEQFGNFVIRSPEHGRISGAVVPLEGHVYEFEQATLAGQKLTFVTRKVGGISYSFDGTFRAAPPFTGDKSVAVIEGTLRKFRNDQMAAGAVMKFRFDEGGEEP